MNAPEGSSSTWKHFAIPAVAALVGYFVLYAIDSHLRTRRGPWEVEFHAEPDGTPAVTIRQRSLQISNVTVRFVGESVPEHVDSLPQTIAFAAPAMLVPFGKAAFDDLMYLPGTVVLHCFGHEVQMLPRALFLNRKEHAWRSDTEFDLTPEQKLPTLDPPETLRRR